MSRSRVPAASSRRAGHLRARATLVLALAATFAASLAPGAPVSAAPALEPWERTVADEIARQNDAFQASKAAGTRQAVVSRYANRVGRDASALNEFLHGRALFYADDRTAAKSAMERALAAEPRFYPARLRLGLLYRELGRHADAERELRAVLAQKPDEREALELLAGVAVDRKDWEAAAAWTSRLVASDPSDAKARLNLALVHMQRKDWAAAEREVAALQSRDASNLAYRHLLGAICLETGRAERGIGLLESVVREQPGDVESLKRLVRAYRERSGWTRLQHTLERLLPYVTEEARTALLGDIALLKDPKRAPSRAPSPERRAVTLDDLVRAAESPDAGRREDALIAIYDACMEGAVKQLPQSVLRRITADVEPSVTARCFVVRIIGTLVPEQILPLLAVALHDESERVRTLAIEIVAGFGHPIGVAYLLPLLDRETASTTERQAVRAALSELTGFRDLPPGVDAVTTPESVAASREAWRRWSLSDASTEVKLKAIAELVAFRDQSAERYLVDFVRDPTFEVMRAAYVAMRDAVARPPAGPVERKVFPLFPVVPDAELTRASMRATQDRVEAWMATWVAEHRAWIGLKASSPTPTPTR